MMIDAANSKELISSYQKFWNLGISSSVVGKVKILANEEKATKMLLRCMDWNENVFTEYDYHEGESIFEKKAPKKLKIGKYKYELEALFMNNGIGDIFDLTISNIFKLSYGLSGVDHEFLYNQDFKMEFDYINRDHNSKAVDVVFGTTVVHKKGKEENEFKKGKLEGTYLAGKETFISVIPEKEVKIAKTFDNPASFAMDSLCYNLYILLLSSKMYTKQEIIDELKKNREKLLKLLNISSLMDIAEEGEELPKEMVDAGLLDVLKKADE